MIGVTGLRKLFKRETPSPTAGAGDQQLMKQNPIYSRYQIGRWTYGNPIVQHWNEGACLIIGDFCSLADGSILLLGGNHRADWITTSPLSLLLPGIPPAPGHPCTKGDIVLGHDVWVGRDAMILSGVSVGNGAVIGARAVVSRDVPSYAIVVGNPATVVKYRFSASTIEQLNAIAWWDWPDEEIRRNAALLQSDRVEEFVQTFARGRPE